MKTNPTALLENMIEALNDLQGLKENDADSIIKAINIVAVSISELNSYILSQPFQSEAEEINFFKKIKPEFDGRMIFYLMLLKKSHCSPETPANSDFHYLKVCNDFQKTPFWIYFKMGSTHFDQQYFLRSAQNNEVIYEEHQLYYDRRTNASMSAEAARIVGYDLFKEHLHKTMLIKVQTTINDSKGAEKAGLQWNASVAAVTELIYALHEYGVFGKSIEIKRIADCLSMAFNIRITNIYKTWEDIRLRKKDRTPFIRSLLVMLERRIDRDNEFAP